ncbi:MAG TPA: prohibitin family protein [Leptolinea sp.]
MLVETLQFISLLAWVLFISIILSTFVFNLRYGIKVAFRRTFSFKLWLPASAILLLTLLVYTLVFIPPQEVGVVVSLLAPEGYRSQPIRSGIHFIVPLAESVVRYPISWTTITIASRATDGLSSSSATSTQLVARTSDGQAIIVDCSLIYRIQPEFAIRIYIDWQQRYETDFILPLLRSYLRTTISQFNVDEINSSKRIQLEADLDNQLRQALEEKGFALDRFLLRNITFSPEYAAVIERKQVAQQEEIVKMYEAEQLRKLASGNSDSTAILAEGTAKALELEAQGRAQARLVEGQAQADVLKVISRALGDNKLLVDFYYVDRLSPQMKAMLLPNNAPLILPLGDLLNSTDIPAQATSSALDLLKTLVPDQPTITITPTPLITSSSGLSATPTPQSTKITTPTPTLTLP